ncbi:hypothetical protein H5410_029448 [Solanum commersonii]|uniref:Self-pruning interacting protein 1 n=1 Tax=Solanum commersonii TaxID=4109 RepID=A0A9J5Z916_SOLCO|nr:hypothetical protein H5410_029448 [Solanum commersonii]
MSIDPELLEMKLPNIKVITSSNDDEYINCQTPKSSQYLIPKILSCPPAPKKPKRMSSCSSCKRKLIDEFKFFDEQEEIESFFRFVDVNSTKKRRRCLV